MSFKIENKDIPLVSICCLTYNHEPYIRQTLNSFLLQKTNFPFEIVIHDDASTDNTANIIKEYTEKYPNIFNPLLQKENQRSKLGGGMNPKFNYPRAKGKFIAFCDGDDYWIDPLKLQKQVDFLKRNRECSFVFHKTKRFNEIKQIFVESIPFEVTKEVLNVNEFFKIKAVPTCSIMFKNSVEFVKFNHSHGDFALYCTLISNGKAGYIKDEMAVYRLNEGGVSRNNNSFNYLKRRINELKIESKYESFTNEVKKQVKGAYIYQVYKLINLHNGQLSLNEKKQYFLILFSEILNWKKLDISFSKVLKIFFNAFFRKITK